MENLLVKAGLPAQNLSQDNRAEQVQVRRVYDGTFWLPKAVAKLYANQMEDAEHKDYSPHSLDVRI